MASRRRKTPKTTKNAIEEASDVEPAVPARNAPAGAPAPALAPAHGPAPVMTVAAATTAIMTGADGDLWGIDEAASELRPLGTLETALRMLALQPAARELLAALLDMPIGAPAYATSPDMMMRPTGMYEVGAANQTIGYLLLKVLLFSFLSFFFLLAGNPKVVA